MNELTLEWLEKAEGDLDVSFEFLRDLLVVLDRYSVSYRYPGESAGKDEARLAFRAVTNVRSFVCAKLGVSPESGS